MSENKNGNPDNTIPDADRRALMTGAAGGVLSALLGLAATPVHATSGIGFASPAQAQAGDTPIGAKWWPSRWGAEDQAGASNHITAEKRIEIYPYHRHEVPYEHTETRFRLIQVMLRA